METMKLNVYNEDGTLEKTVEAEMIDLEFGTIRSLMELLNIENVDDTTGLLKTVYGAWDDITGILNRAFPEMLYEDWDHVKLKELIPLLMDILKYSFTEILTIPRDEKN